MDDNANLPRHVRPALADPGQLTARLRGERLINDAEVIVGPGSGMITALIVPQGYRPGHVLRRLAMRVAGDMGARLQVVLLREIPRGPGGGIDHREVLAAMRRPGALHRFEPPVSDIERLVSALVLEVLPGVVEVSMTDSLPALGGSLATLELTGLISERLGLDIDPQRVFEAESLRELAAILSSAKHRDPA